MLTRCHTLHYPFIHSSCHCLLAIYSFTMDCLFISFACFPIGSCVDICFCLFNISFPIFW